MIVMNDSVKAYFNVLVTVFPWFNVFMFNLAVRKYQKQLYDAPVTLSVPQSYLPSILTMLKINCLSDSNDNVIYISTPIQSICLTI